MADFFSVLWTIISFILGILWSLVWFILRDLISTVLWIGIVIWVGFVLRHRSFSLGSLAMLRHVRYGVVMLWRWVLGRPVQGGLIPPEPVTKIVKEYQQRIPLGYASVSEQMNVALVLLLIIMAHV
jgi:membrane protein DedA with SNARE-associated domain